MPIEGRWCSLCGKDYTGTLKTKCTDGFGMKACEGDIMPPPEAPQCAPKPSRQTRKKVESNT